MSSKSHWGRSQVHIQVKCNQPSKLAGICSNYQGIWCSQLQSPRKASYQPKKASHTLVVVILGVLCPFAKSPQPQGIPMVKPKPPTPTVLPPGSLLKDRWGFLITTTVYNCTQAWASSLMFLLSYYVLNDEVLMFTGKFCGDAFLLSLEMQQKSFHNFGLKISWSAL